MPEFHNHERPDWCPHQECQFVLHTQDVACVGRLPEPADHGPHKGVNDGRFCMKDLDSGEVYDFQIHKGDLLGLKRIFGTLYPPSANEADETINQDIHEKLARCSSAGEVRRMIEGTGNVLIEVHPHGSVADKLPLVLYFEDEDDREEFVQVILAEKPGMRALKV